MMGILPIPLFLSRFIFQETTCCALFILFGAKLLYTFKKVTNEKYPAHFVDAHFCLQLLRSSVPALIFRTLMLQVIEQRTMLIYPYLLNVLKLLVPCFMVLGNCSSLFAFRCPLLAAIISRWLML